MTQGEPFTHWQRWKGILKCVPFEEKRLAKWTPPFVVQPKYDGVRCRAIRTGAGFVLLSSEENIIYSVPHINVILDGITHLNHELDGELYCHGMKFEEIFSITSRTTNLHPNHRAIQYHIFDVADETLPQYLRIPEVEKYKGLSEYLVIAPYYLCNNLDDVLRVYEKIIHDGFEGIIVRHPANMYVRKRSTMVMKFKPKQSDEYQIISTTEEIDKEGEPKGSLGALTCLSNASHVNIDQSTKIAINYNNMTAIIDGKIYDIFNVGTGFSAEQRQIFWEIKDNFVGRIAKVKYQHQTAGKAVPRFPVFVEVK